MLEPKYTFVGLAGQKAWHICTAEAPPPRVNGKYRPSQLRTQKAGPELATAGGSGCGLLLKGFEEEFSCGETWRCSLCRPPKKKSKRPSAEASDGISAAAPAMLTTTGTRYSLRRKDDFVPNAYSADAVDLVLTARDARKVRIQHKGGW